LYQGIKQENQKSVLMKYGLVFICLLYTLALGAFEPYYHSVKAEPGDGIYSLLRRYNLLDYQCNQTKFLELNTLSKNDVLLAGKEYLLPIKIYEYNGTSIRTTVGISDWNQAVRIKDYNDKILNESLRRTKYQDSNILWVPHHELECVKDESGEEVQELSEKPKESIKKGTYKQVEIFGDDHKMVEIVSKDLSDKVYYLVAGHGGPDPGAMCGECSNTLCEDEYAYDVILRLARYLIARNAIVHIVIQDENDGIRDDEILDCDYDEKCFGAKIPRNQKLRLRQRAEAINELYKSYKKKGHTDQVAVMIHIDSNNKGHRQDVYFYHHKTSKSSKKLAQSLQSTFKEKYNHFQKNRGYHGFVSTRNLYMLNYTLPTSVFVELANIRNSFDHKRIVIPSNREALAKWLFEGITEAQL